MMLFKKNFLVGALVFSLFIQTGCEMVGANVERFHDESALVQGKSFIFVPMKGQGGLEYDMYKQNIGNQLIAHGYIPAKAKKKADYFVTFVYNVSGRDVLVSRPIFGQTGGGTTSYTNGRVNAYSPYGSSYGTYSGTTYTPPTYGIVGSSTATETVFTRGLGLNIKTNKDRPVFTGTVISQGSSSSFSDVSNCMIAAMFQDFPGNNGGSEYIELPTESCK